MSTSMSYPQLLYACGQTEDFVIFTVPNHQVIKKITHDSGHSNLRVRAAAKVLSRGVSELAFLLSTYNAEIVSPYGENSLQIRLDTELMKVNTRKYKQEIADRRQSYIKSRPRNKLLRSTLATIYEEDVASLY
jgi:hypothetical protein